MIALSGRQPWWWGILEMGVNAFVLDDVEPLPFVAWPGALGLFEVPDDYATREPPSTSRRENWNKRQRAT